VSHTDARQERPGDVPATSTRIVDQMSAKPGERGVLTYIAASAWMLVTSQEDVLLSAKSDI
jgi:hypothetical protein